MSNSSIKNIFEDQVIISKIQKKLPKLFQLAEIDNLKDGKLGMEIGSTRERIIIALLIHEFGEHNVRTEIPITESEIDIIVFDQPVSIKTVTNKNIIGIKLVWTVDAQKSLEFINNYQPKSNMLFVHINWDFDGGMYLISKTVQQETLQKYGKESYFKLPKQGTNPRGVEITKQAIKELVNHNSTKKIEINWMRNKSLKYAPYKRWLELWGENDN